MFAQARFLGSLIIVSSGLLAIAAQPGALAGRLSVEPREISIGESVVVSWDVPSGVGSVYISGADPSQANQRSGRVVVRPRATSDFLLLVQSASGAVGVQAARVTVAGPRGSLPQLTAKDLSCVVDLPLTIPKGLDLLGQVKRGLQSSNIVVDQEFIRDASAIVLQTRALAQRGRTSDASGVREAIHQVALGLNLSGNAGSTGGVTMVSVGSQLRFRRLQDTEFEIDTDSARCFETTRPLADIIRPLLGRS
jgi:hypothetical protein